MDEEQQQPTTGPADAGMPGGDQPQEAPSQPTEETPATPQGDEDSGSADQSQEESGQSTEEESSDEEEPSPADSSETAEPIGKITHYFGKIGVGVIELTNGSLKVGDTVKIKGGDREFEQTVNSMQIDRNDVQSAEAGQAVGIKIDQLAKEDDLVYKAE